MILLFHLDRFYVTGFSEKPTVVLRNRTVLDVNDKANQAGVQLGMKLSEARSILVKNPEQVQAQYIDWIEEKYEEARREWLDRCVEFSDIIEATDQHQAFIDLSKHAHPENLIPAMRKALFQHHLRIGFGHSKWMAEASLIQNDREGLAYFAPNAFLDELPIACMSIVSPQARKRLELLGYRTASEIQSIPLKVLKTQFGDEALIIRSASFGRGGSAIHPNYPHATIGDRFYFDAPVDQEEPVTNALRALSHRLAEILLPSDLSSNHMRIHFEFEERTETRERIFSKPLQNPRSIFFAASLLSKLEEPVLSIRIQLLEVKKTNRKQTELYRSRSEGADVLETSVREVQRHYGEQSVRKASHFPLSRRQQLLKVWKDATGWT